MIKPIGEYVLIEPDKIEDKTESGIFLPEMKKDRLQTGTVVNYLIPFSPNLKKGTRIWFKMWAGEPIKYEGKDYLLIHKKDLIAFEDKRGEK